MPPTSPNPADELANAVGRYALGEISLGKAAEVAGLSRWEFEEILEDAGFAALYGPQDRDELRAEISTARRRCE
jgi:predicted HTH domain antitoxin